MPVPPPTRGPNGQQRNSGWLILVMLFALVIFSAVSTQVSIRQQATQLKSRQWQPETTEATIGGIRATGDGHRIEVTQAGSGAVIDPDALVQGGSVFLQAKTGEQTTIGGATVGIAMVTAHEAQDFEEVPPTSDAPGAWAAQSSAAYDAEAPPTYIATFVLATNADDLFERVEITAFDNQGVPLTVSSGESRRTEWGGRLLFLTFSDVLPSDVQFLDFVPRADQPPAKAAHEGSASVDNNNDVSDNESPGDSSDGESADAEASETATEAEGS